jgi:hypothetical protein
MTNPWLQTHSGNAFYYTDPDRSHIAIHDIAAALSKICRFHGHCLKFYSVAQHSVLVSHHVETVDGFSALSFSQQQNVLRWALMHDAAKAYIGDIARPLRYSLEGMSTYNDYEQDVLRAIAHHFGMTPLTKYVYARYIEVADLAVLARERIEFMAPCAKRGLKWESLEDITPAASVGGHADSPETAEVVFLDRFFTLFRSYAGS